ncbi:hypothetical protein [Caballeronia sp. GaOx3]|uniref:hypothetical protein n=1 Tax=Caballeronia sp. GaOx3 TaxID=2921740 RepID=UPI002028290D|nr:hypothetical protein [Caballeronia sp. GaOx3]
MRAYLNRFRDQPKTLRAYTKELKRFLLWAVVLRGKALSDLRVDDCEAYKDLLPIQLPFYSFVFSAPRAQSPLSLSRAFRLRVGFDELISVFVSEYAISISTTSAEPSLNAVRGYVLHERHFDVIGE